MSIFKAYDIRGIYGTELTEDLAYRTGRAFVSFLKCKKVVIGRDMRPHSGPLRDALVRGITEQGADVIDIGLATTPMSYFANGYLDADGSIIITASHNPGEYNGFKLCEAQAVPISGATGIKDIERMAMEEDFSDPPSEPGQVTEQDILPAYKQHILQFSTVNRPLKVAIDYANAMGIVEGKVFEDLFEITPLFDELDGSFPNHEANPLDLDTFADLQTKVKAGTYDFGMAFDGDADRVGFVDEHGEIISMDIITAIIATSLLKKQQGTVLYDLRSSWAVKEIIEEHGGHAVMSRVGHAFIKNQMREHQAIFAGELSGHYYFQENSFAESSALAAIFIANMICESGKTLSQIAAPIQRYHASGEINSRVEESPDMLFDRIKALYPDGHETRLDGLSLEFDDWWFNVRMSNTEPLCRLNLEAKDAEKMATKRDEVLAHIRQA